MWGNDNGWLQFFYRVKCSETRVRIDCIAYEYDLFVEEIMMLCLISLC